MDKRFIGIIIIIAGGIILAGIIYFIFISDHSLSGIFRKIDSEQVVNNTGDDQRPPANDSAESKNIRRIVLDMEELKDLPAPPEIEKDAAQIKKDDLKRLAASFAERFGSYSNQSNFSNITDLKIFMSQRMRQWADDYINERRGQGVSGDLYYGITTKAVAQEVKEIDDDTGEAAILVKTRRREASGSTINTSNVFDQNIMINLIKEGGAWKVDTANWQ